MKKIMCLAGALFLSLPLYATDDHEIEDAFQNKRFIIDEARFEAKTLCKGWEKGDLITFLRGSASGFCVTAILYNKNRNELCEVWCE